MEKRLEVTEFAHLNSITYLQQSSVCQVLLQQYETHMQELKKASAPPDSESDTGSASRPASRLSHAGSSESKRDEDDEGSQVADNADNSEGSVGEDEDGMDVEGGGRRASRSGRGRASTTKGGRKQKDDSNEGTPDPTSLDDGDESVADDAGGRGGRKGRGAKRSRKASTGKPSKRLREEDEDETPNNDIADGRNSVALDEEADVVNEDGPADLQGGSSVMVRIRAGGHSGYVCLPIAAIRIVVT